MAFLTESHEAPPPSGGYGYTPDLSGSPYVVSDEGLMVVDFAGGERRLARVDAADLAGFDELGEVEPGKAPVGLV